MPTVILESRIHQIGPFKPYHKLAFFKILLESIQIAVKDGNFLKMLFFKILLESIQIAVKDGNFLKISPLSINFLKISPLSI